MKKTGLIFIALLCTIAVAHAQESLFPLPDVPQSLTDAAERANYMAEHYWDRYDFNDTTLIDNVEVSEQGFTNFISIMPYVTEQEKAFEIFARRITSNPVMLRYFVAVGKKYLADSYSPVYNEELYIMMLDALLSLDNMPAIERERLSYDVEVAKKNRIGSIATDFEFLLKDGRYSRLSQVKGKYILILFGDPDCNDCNEAKNAILSAPFIASAVNGRDLTILSVCVEGKTDKWLHTQAPMGWIDACDESMYIYDNELYDFDQLPSCYLLDSNYTVVLRDVHVGLIDQFFMSH